MARPALSAMALPALLALAGCESPTQISVVVQTDVACSSVSATSLTAGELGAIENAPPTTESSTCSAGHLGTVVLVPSGSESEEVAFKVVTSLNGEPKILLENPPRSGTVPAISSGRLPKRRVLSGNSVI